ncbi:MAG: electron transfer flavoprotein subunit beta/FixA family protein [archaeon]|nr:electron transfer flavoprotein subunit beta/FixA family protein [archaeon]MCP8305532.1 electron transfer flavoprotein subunit beta/FixA family protein [archaeon]
MGHGAKDEKEFNVIVLVKQVPEAEDVRIDPDTGRLDRSSAEAVTNPFDLNAIEVANRIKERLGGKVTCISMGPLRADSTLRDSLARGCDRGILLSDKKFGGADTLATSYTLSCAIKKIGSFDLIVCGEKTTDGDTGQVGPEVAEQLDIPHACFVEEIKAITESSLVVRRKTENGYMILELKLPALISVTKDINEPPLPLLKNKIKARKAEIETWSASDLSEIGDVERFGLTGSPTRVVNVGSPHVEKETMMIEGGSSREKAKKLVDILEDLGFL